MTLYELTQEYQMLLEIAEDPDTDQQTFIDTLDGLSGEIEMNADGYAKVIRQMESDAAGLKAEIDRLTARKRAIDNSVDRMKEALKNAMILTYKTKFKTELFSFSVVNNPASVVLDSLSIPKEYLIIQEPKVDKAKIRDDLKKGKVLKFAHLESTLGIRIK